VVNARQVTLDYVDRQLEPSRRVVEPLGLAAKGSTWYLIAETAAGLRTFRVDRVREVEATGEAVTRPDGFDLAEAWRNISDEVEERRMPVRVRAMAEADALPVLRYLFGPRVDIGPSGSDGRVEVGLRGHSVASLAAELGGLGARLQVIDPPELRRRLGEIGTELSALYPA